MNATDLRTFAPGTKIIVNGRKFTVIKSYTGDIFMVGSHGGECSVVRNLASGKLFLLSGSQWKTNKPVTELRAA